MNRDESSATREEGITLVPALAAMRCRGPGMGINYLSMPLTFPPAPVRFNYDAPWLDSICHRATLFVAAIQDLPTPYG